MCLIGERTSEAFLEHLVERAALRRGVDKLRCEDPGAAPNPHRDRPAPHERYGSTLCYAVSFAGRRYAGYSGAAGGMSYQEGEGEDARNVFVADERARKRLGRLSEKVGYDFTKGGIPGLRGEKRPYCRCAEPAALSIAVSYKEKVGDLTFCAFVAPPYDAKKRLSVVFSPCPNCMSWLNRFAGGYITKKSDDVGLRKKATANAATADLQEGGKHASRRDSNAFISIPLTIDPKRKCKDTPFKLGGETYIHRCFNCKD